MVYILCVDIYQIIIGCVVSTTEVFRSQFLRAQEYGEQGLQNHVVVQRSSAQVKASNQACDYLLRFTASCRPPVPIHGISIYFPVVLT